MTNPFGTEDWHVAREKKRKEHEEKYAGYISLLSVASGTVLAQFADVHFPRAKVESGALSHFMKRDGTRLPELKEQKDVSGAPVIETAVSVFGFLTESEPELRVSVRFAQRKISWTQPRFWDRVGGAKASYMDNAGYDAFGEYGHLRPWGLFIDDSAYGAVTTRAAIALPSTESELQTVVVNLLKESFADWQRVSAGILR